MSGFFKQRKASESSNVLTVASSSESGETQNLIINHGDFEILFLLCSVCLQRFNLPKTFPCDHVFCLTTLKSVFSNTRPSGSDRKKIKCPTCSTEISLSEKEINDLPNDFRVVQMMDLMSASPAVPGNTCTTHVGQVLQFFCTKCKVPACRDCPVVDHKQTDGHDMTNLKKILDEEVSQSNEVKRASDDIQEKLTARSQFLRDALGNLEFLETALKKNVEEKFDEYMRVLKERQRAIIDNIHTTIADQKSKVKLKDMKVQAAMLAIQEESKRFSAARTSNDVHKMLTMNDKMRNVNEFMIKYVENGDDTKLLKSCEFKTQDDVFRQLQQIGYFEVKEFTEQELRRDSMAQSTQKPTPNPGKK